MKKLEISQLEHTKGGNCQIDAGASCVVTAIIFGGPVGLLVGVAMAVSCSFQ